MLKSLSILILLQVTNFGAKQTPNQSLGLTEAQTYVAVWLIHLTPDIWMGTALSPSAQPLTQAAVMGRAKDL